MKDIKKLARTTSLSAVMLAIGLSTGLFMNSQAQNSGKVFELRTYTATEGNLDKLHARFRNHTTRIFNKHGMEVVGYWSPTSEEERDDTLVYILEHESQEAANASWRAFGQDPEWARVAEESNADGQILGGIERKYMTATDYSPMQ